MRRDKKKEGESTRVQNASCVSHENCIHASMIV